MVIPAVDCMAYVLGINNISQPEHKLGQELAIQMMQDRG
jgi:hypothetical protein